jgi:hypothetical protein
MKTIHPWHYFININLSYHSLMAQKLWQITQLKLTRQLLSGLKSGVDERDVAERTAAARHLLQTKQR